MLKSILMLLTISLIGGTLEAAQPSRKVMAIDLAGTHIEGIPLFSSASTVQFLARDGRLLDFSADQARQFRKTTANFNSYSVMEMRLQLIQELGKSFEVTNTGHYLVGYPKGQKDYWSPRFEELYRSFVHYFNVRGFHLKNPEFPMVAIVWPNKQAFLRYAQSDGSNIGNNVLGYYSPKTNRISLYDIGGGSARSEHWQQNSDTIIHEATHQTAFNTGIHGRFAHTPRWVVEGLGTMFEAPGVWKSRDNPRREDRINRGRLQAFQRIAASHKTEMLTDLISSDRIFNTDANAAYANAWAFSFYLIETQARRYADYLALTAKRPELKDYPASERMADFVSIFGKDFTMMETRFLRFMSEQK
jgi:hypothetical protein